MINKEKLFIILMEYYSGDPHQIQHAIKVHSFALRIGIAENLDKAKLDILETAAILHDIGIKASVEKYGSSAGKYQEIEGPPIARAMLEGLQYPAEVIDRVCHLIGRHHTYSGIDGEDYQILVEADFLVNLFENNSSHDAIAATIKKIFRTKTGKRICETMYGSF